MKLTFLYPLLGLVAGIFFNARLLPGYGLPLICIGLSLLVWALLKFLGTNPLNTWKQSAYHSVWIFFLFAGIGAWDYRQNFSMHTDREIDGRELTFVGRVTEARDMADGDRFIISVDSLFDNRGHEIKCRNLSIILKTDGYSAFNGDIIKFKAKPGKFKTDSGRGRKYAEAMNRRGIYYTAFKSGSEIIKTGKSYSPADIFSRMRREIVIAIEKSSLSKNTSNFIVSILLGDKSHLPSATRETLSSAGMAHILAVSGLHVGIILAFFMALFFPLSFTGHKTAGKVIALLLVWLYVILTGMAPSTLRAAIMATMVIGAYILQRKNSSLNALLAAALIILLFRPGDLWNIGFQLSFTAVFAIIIFADRLNPIDRHTHHALHNLFAALLISIISTLATWPLVAFYFKNVPLSFLPANIILLPVLPLYIGLAMVYVLLLLLKCDFHLLAEGLNRFHDLFISWAGFLSSDDKAVLNFKMEETGIFIWLAGIILFGIATVVNRKGKRWIFSGLAGACCLSAIAIGARESGNGESLLHFSHDFALMKARLIGDDDIREFNFPRNKVSDLSAGSARVLAVDCCLKDEYINTLKDSERTGRDFLIVGPGADICQITRLVETGNFEKVILHSNFGRNREAELKEALEDGLREKIHSLRESGSLEVSL